MRDRIIPYTDVEQTLSSTGRRERQPNDYYRTPGWVVSGILPFLNITHTSAVLDPACGDGSILDAISNNTTAGGVKGIEVCKHLWEMASENHAVMLANALREDWRGYTHIIMNPPYSLSMQFVQKAVDTGAVVAALLRLAWLGSEGRTHFHNRHPSGVFVITPRPSFTHHLKFIHKQCDGYVGRKRCQMEHGHGGEHMIVGGADSCDYAWFVWGSGYEHQWRILRKEGGHKHDKKVEVQGVQLNCFNRV